MTYLFSTNVATRERIADEHNGTFELPSNKTLERSRVRLDLTRTLIHRELRGPRAFTAHRLFNFDGSPRSGIEIFSVVAQLWILLDGVWQTEVIRYPLTSLGQGCPTVMGKTNGVVACIVVILRA